MGLAHKVLASRTLAALTSPHGVDRYLELVNPMWAATEVRARLVDVRREVDLPGVPPVATLTFQPTHTWQGHKAGQYVQLGVEVKDGVGAPKRVTRCFTVASAESGAGDNFQITMRANPEGTVSRYLVEHAQVGQIVHLSQAEGDFTLPDRVPEHVLFITGGSGITPAMSMLRSLQRRTHRGRVTFLHYAQSPEHQIFAEELADIAMSGYGVDVHLVYPEAGGRFFSALELARIVPDYREVDTWACGPAGLIELVRHAYDGPEGPTDKPTDKPSDKPSDKLRVEYFKAPITPSGTAEGSITFERAGKTVGNDGTSILEQAEAAGLTPEFGCRMGICFSCTKTKTGGTVRNVLTGETSSLPDEEIRICVSTAEGDCSVEL